MLGYKNVNTFQGHHYIGLISAGGFFIGLVAGIIGSKLTKRRLLRKYVICIQVKDHKQFNFCKIYSYCLQFSPSTNWWWLWHTCHLWVPIYSDKLWKTDFKPDCTLWYQSNLNENASSADESSVILAQISLQRFCKEQNLKYWAQGK